MRHILNQIVMLKGNNMLRKSVLAMLFILFGRAVAEDGKPIANADVSGSHGVARTDGDGYFQIETSRDERLGVSRKTGPVCMIPVGAAPPVDGFVSAGDQICR